MYIKTKPNNYYVCEECETETGTLIPCKYQWTRWEKDDEFSLNVEDKAICAKCLIKSILG